MVKVLFAWRRTGRRLANRVKSTFFVEHSLIQAHPLVLAIWGIIWHREMHKLLQEMIHAVKENDRYLSKNQIHSFEDEYVRILSLAQSEYAAHPPSRFYPDGFNLYKRLRDYNASTLYFLRHPEVDYTNNHAERELRKFKRKQKQAVVLRSSEGSQHICDALTIIESA